MKSFLLSSLLIFIVFANVEYSQWVQLNGPYGGVIKSMTASGANIYAGTSGGGVFLSTNNGSNWTMINGGLNYSNNINALLIVGSNLYVGVETGIYLTTNNGNSWTTLKYY